MFSCRHPALFSFLKDSADIKDPTNRRYKALEKGKGLHILFGLHCLVKVFRNLLYYICFIILNLQLYPNKKIFSQTYMILNQKI